MAKLTERGVQTAKFGRHSDGDGLHLVVSETGRKKWVLRYQVGGVRRDKGLGSYPEVGLKEARSRAGRPRPDRRGRPHRGAPVGEKGLEASAHLRGDRAARDRRRAEQVDQR
jgi:hypothetical protein